MDGDGQLRRATWPAIANSIADSSSAAGNPATFQWTYTGPAINPVGARQRSSPRRTAIQTDVQLVRAATPRGYLHAWRALVGAAFPGVSVTIPNGLTSPNVRAYAVGVSRQFATARPCARTTRIATITTSTRSASTRTTGNATDSLGNRADLGIRREHERPEAPLSAASRSRPTIASAAGRTFGGSYTLSRLWGNFDGENVASGPVNATVPVSGVPPGGMVRA